MLHALLDSVTLFALLFDIDADLAAQTRARQCPHCGGALHQANYWRKPRGERADIPEAYRLRRSLCCETPGCRRRALPPSLLFMDRRVYWRMSVLVVMALRQGRAGSWSVKRLAELVGATPSTIQRWFVFWRDRFPTTPLWLRLRGRVPVLTRSDLLPLSLLQALGNDLSALLRLMGLLADADLGVIEQALRGREISTQNLLDST